MTPEDILSREAKSELNKIKEIEKMVERENLVYKANEHTYSFKNFQTIKVYFRDIYKSEITLKKANEYQIYLLSVINFKRKTKPQDPEKNKIKKIYLNVYMHFLVVEKEFLMLLKV